MSKIPFNEDLKLDEPVSLYAASKKSNELMAYTYSHLFKIETIGLRFFTFMGHGVGLTWHYFFLQMQ